MSVRFKEFTHCSNFCVGWHWSNGSMAVVKNIKSLKTDKHIYKRTSDSSYQKNENYAFTSWNVLEIKLNCSLKLKRSHHSIYVLNKFFEAIKHFIAYWLTLLCLYSIFLEVITFLQRMVIIEWRPKDSCMVLQYIV